MTGRTLIDHTGAVDQRTVLSLVKAAELSLANARLEPVRMKRIIRAMVEVLQNVAKHAVDKYATFTLIQTNTFIYLESHNSVFTDKTFALHTMLSKIRNASALELKNIWKTSLVKNASTENGGSGLGLIALARIAGAAPIIKVTPTSDHCFELHLQLKF